MSWDTAQTARLLLISLLISIMVGCQATRIDTPMSEHHLTQAELSSPADIPAVLPALALPLLPVPQRPEPTFTVVVNRVPVRQLLFSLARDAELNADIFDEISGRITLNAIEQTLPEIMQRIARQASIRYEISDDQLIVTADSPYWKTYKVPYVNLSRESEGQIELATQVANTAGNGVSLGGANNSRFVVNNISRNAFWQTLFVTLSTILDTQINSSTDDLVSDTVVVNREAGLITVRSTEKQHEQIADYLQQVIASVQRQVLIEATIVEVNLNNQYQSGVDWARIASGGDGVSVAQNLITGVLPNPFAGASPAAGLNYIRTDDPTRNNITANVRLLEQFGDVRVLSSPKMMVINNQTAVLKVVDNRVYFNVDIQESVSEFQNQTRFETTINTVPIGLIMSLTPYIGEDGQVILNVRPTISRILGFINDPNPAFINEDDDQQTLVNQVPEIQVREMESILRLNDQQIGVIGGLMQDRVDKNTDGIPGVSRLPGIGQVFKNRNDQIQKTELVIFLRPQIVNQPDINQDLRSMQGLLPADRPLGRP